jgi:dTDP-3-amino-3,4,6-trideoxy-alpha-D-glucose transaminase
MDPLLDICREHELRVVEDACQAHGARYRGRPVGSLGDAGCFSFYPTKNLGCWGDGGAVTTGDEKLAERLRLLRSHGEGTRHHHEVASGTHRLHALQAALLEVKLRRLADWNDRRRAAGAALRDALADNEHVVPMPPPGPDEDHVYHLFVVRCDDRDSLREHLDAAGVASAIHYPTPIHLQPAYSELGLKPGDLPVAERLAGEICSLPMFPAVESREISRIAESVASFARPESPAG